MYNKFPYYAVVSIGVCLVQLPFQSAQAAIKCVDSYQIVKGQPPIGTPYCGDKWLSRISGVSFAKIRNDPTERRRVCLMYRADVKVSSICGIDADPYIPNR